MSQTLTIEHLKYSYFDRDALREPSYTIHRVATPKGRYYYTLGKRGKVRFYISVTNLLEKFMPTPRHLLEWIARHGMEGAEKIKNQRGSYGTLMHIANENLVLNHKFDIDSLPDFVKGYFLEHETWGGKQDEFSDELYKDLYGFYQFLIDREVNALAVEIGVKSDKFGIAGALDLFCTLLWNGKRVYAIIDYKGSKKGFYESNELQLELYKQCILEEWPELKDKKIMLFNWSGKNWRKSPTYNLVDQTNKHSLKELKLYADMYKEKNKNKPIGAMPVIDFFGTLDLETKTLENNYKILQLTQKVRDHDKNQKQRPQQNKNSASNNRKTADRRKKGKQTRKRVSGKS